MKSSNLINIFESAVAQLNGLQNTKYLKDFVNHWKNGKIKGQYIIKPEDFNILLSKGAAADSFREDLLSNTPENYSNSSSAGRLYNLYNNIKQRTVDHTLDPERRKYYKDVEDEFTGLIKKTINTLTPQTSVQTVPDDSIVPADDDTKHTKSISIDDTKYLKDRNEVIFGNQKYIINDNMLSVFKDIHNENVNMYYDAIVQGDDSLKSNVSTPQGVVYTLFKGLKDACNNTVSDYVELRSRMNKLMGRSTTDSPKKDKEKKEKKFVDVESVSLSRIGDNAKIQIRYEILGEGNIFGGLFILHHLRHTYELINQQDKNNFFIFDKPIPLQGLIEVGLEYNLIYNSVSRTNDKLTIKILELKINSTESISEYDECSAVDELIKLIYNIRYGS